MMFTVGMGGMAMAGNIDSPGAPSAGSGMYTLKQIYDYLSAGTAATKQTSFQDPTAGPGSTGYTLKDVYAAVATPFPQCDATVSDVGAGRKFFCAVSGSWGLKTGTKTVPYCTLLKTGQTSVYVTGDDGSKNKGVAFSYTNTTSNSVTDNVTGLMWAKSIAGAGCCSGSTPLWSSAVSWAIGLTFDGYSDWRLPNITELQSLCVRNAAWALRINTTYFPDTTSSHSFWSSTTIPTATANVYTMAYYSTLLGTNGAAKNGTLYVRAVRGGL